MAKPETPEVQFFYGLGSRYSYLASTRIDHLIRDTGARVRWRPLYSGDLFGARGADPFKGTPVSGQYDFTYRRFDAECWADYYGVPYREPNDVRFDPRRLALACAAAGRENKVAALSRRLFQVIFADGLSPVDDQVCAQLAAEAGLDGEALRAAIDDPKTDVALRATVDEALALGVFGVPSFAFDGHVFFGNDRLAIIRHRLLRRGGTTGWGGPA